MPIQYQIDPVARLVIARAEGVLTEKDVFAYQTEVWSRPEVAGYNELVDMTAVTKIEMIAQAQDTMKKLASLSSRMDHPAIESKLVIVAPDNLSFGYGRMYEAFRGMEKGGTKTVHVFRSPAEALTLLGIEAIPDRPEPEPPIPENPALS
jgi:hypothetical protein